MPGDVIVGFYGKLPARGDFVRAGLPRDFIDPWDDWLQSVMAGSRTLMGEAWLPAFLEAPVWRFTLPPGMCGAQAALGLMLPSVDRAGRYFPLTFAALSPRGDRRRGRRGVARPMRSRWTHSAGTGYAARGDRSTRWVQPTCRRTRPARTDALWWSEGSARVEACLYDVALSARCGNLCGYAGGGDRRQQTRGGEMESTS